MKRIIIELTDDEIWWARYGLLDPDLLADKVKDALVVPEREKDYEECNTMEWIPARVGKLFPSNDYKCSKCGNILNFDGVNCGRGDANFCPNCGRKAVSKNDRKRI